MFFYGTSIFHEKLLTKNIKFSGAWCAERGFLSRIVG